MDFPLLYPETKENILRRAADSARQDAAAFAGAFYGKTGALNALPEALYGEYLKLMGAEKPVKLPDMAFVRFDAKDAPQAIGVTRGSRVRCEDGKGGCHVYETAEDIAVVPAGLKGLYCCEAGNSRVWKLTKAGDMPLFGRPEKGEELSGHSFRVTDSRALSLKGPCTVEIEFRQADPRDEAAAAELLADESAVTWTYYNGRNRLPFDSVRAEDGVVILEKLSYDGICADERGDIGIFCDIKGDIGHIEIVDAYIKTIPHGLVNAERMANGDVPVTSEGGYCFGRQPAAGDVFYIRSDTLFTKRGAEAELSLDIETKEFTVYNGQIFYDLGKPVIDKKDAMVIQPDDVYIRQVLWEYFGGDGWRALNVIGEANPFGGERSGAGPVRFTVPEDICPATVNHDRGYYIRARVVYVENSSTRFPKWIVPFVTKADGRWSYPERIPAESVIAENNGQRSRFTRAAGTGGGGFDLSLSASNEPPALYLCFDRLPEACPLSMLLSLKSRAAKPVELAVERWTGTAFERLDIKDDTCGLTRTGCVMAYIRDEVPASDMFGQRGAWLRIRADGPAESGAFLESLEINSALALKCREQTASHFDYPTDRVSVYFPELCGDGVDLTGGGEPQPERYVRHRRAISAADFEELVLDAFSDVRAVKCFSGVDSRGESAPGHVCLAVLGSGLAGRGSDELCRGVYDMLSAHCDGILTSSDRLHVIPAAEVDVNIDMSVRLRDRNMSDCAVRDIARTLRELIESGPGGEMLIGGHIDTGELMRAVRTLENVDSVRSFCAEYSWLDGGRRVYTPAEGTPGCPFGALRAGEINIKTF